MKIAFLASVAVTALSMSMALAQQPATQAPASPPDLGLKVEMEPAALALVKAMSDRLAAAKSMSFTAFTIFESPDRTGLPLAYTTLSQVTVQRPNKLKVISPGDGPRTEFYYDGKTVNAYEPAAKLVATVDAPDTIDAMLRAAFQRAAIYFPFTDLVVSDLSSGSSELRRRVPELLDALVEQSKLQNVEGEYRLSTRVDQERDEVVTDPRHGCGKSVMALRRMQPRRFLRRQQFTHGRRRLSGNAARACPHPDRSTLSGQQFHIDQSQTT